MPTAVETTLYWFYEDGVTQDIGVINQQSQRATDMEQRIRNVIQPLRDGAFVGDTARAFYEASDAFLKFAQETNAEMQNLSKNLNQAMQMTMDMMTAIDAITNE
jgi:uncharacterized protein YukE